MIPFKDGEFVVSMIATGGYGDYIHCITNLGRMYSKNGDKWEYRCG